MEFTILVGSPAHNDSAPCFRFAAGDRFACSFEAFDARVAVGADPDFMALDHARRVDVDGARLDWKFTTESVPLARALAALPGSKLYAGLAVVVKVPAIPAGWSCLQWSHTTLGSTVLIADVDTFLWELVKMDRQED